MRHSLIERLQSPTMRLAIAVAIIGVRAIPCRAIAIQRRKIARPVSSCGEHAGPPGIHKDLMENIDRNTSGDDSTAHCHLCLDERAM
jgi:hypothetical protein